MAVLELIAHARAAGLTILADSGNLIVRGPASAAPLARALGRHKAAILSALTNDNPGNGNTTPAKAADSGVPLPLPATTPPRSRKSTARHPARGVHPWNCGRRSPGSGVVSPVIHPIWPRPSVSPAWPPGTAASTSSGSRPTSTQACGPTKPKPRRGTMPVSQSRSGWANRRRHHELDHSTPLEGIPSPTSTPTQAGVCRAPSDLCVWS